MNNHTKPRKLIAILLKSSFAIGLILCIGWILTATSVDDASVKQVHADITWFGALPTTKYDNFVTTIKDYGFEPPQSYNWNGNDVFVSYKQTEQSPREVLYDLQAEFMKSGVNKDMYSIPPDIEAFSDPNANIGDKMLAVMGLNEFTGGGMIPVSDQADYSALLGVDTHKKAENISEFSAESDQVNADLDKLISSMRYVEAFRDESSNTTTVLAIWSGKNLKFSHFGKSPPQKFNPDDLPVCPGCTLSSDIEGQGKEAGYRVTTYNSPGSPEAVLDFYDIALAPRGWAPNKTAFIADQTAPHIGVQEDLQTRSYSSQGSSLTIQAYRIGGSAETHVNIFQGR